jgi:hypothetical protein
MEQTESLADAVSAALDDGIIFRDPEMRSRVIKAVTLAQPTPPDASPLYRPARSAAEKAAEIVEGFNSGCSPSHFDSLLKEMGEIIAEARPKPAAAPPAADDRMIWHDGDTRYELERHGGKHHVRVSFPPGCSGSCSHDNLADALEDLAKWAFRRANRAWPAEEQADEIERLNKSIAELDGMLSEGEAGASARSCGATVAREG